MNGYTTPQARAQEYVAQAAACLATAKEELAKARAAQARARVWIALIEDTLATATGPGLPDGQVEDLSEQMMDRIRQMKAAGELPADLNTFAALHDHFDANVGWGAPISDLSYDEFTQVVERTHNKLQAL